MNKVSFLMGRPMQARQPATQVVYPRKKPSNMARNIGYGLAGASGLGLAALGAQRAGMFGTFNKAVTQPTPTPKVNPQPKPAWNDWIDKSVQSGGAEHLEQLRQHDFDTSGARVGAAPAAGAVNRYAQADQYLGYGTMAAQLPWIKRIPGVGKVVEELYKPFANLSMGTKSIANAPVMSKLLGTTPSLAGTAGKLAFRRLPALGAPVTMYSALNDDTVPNYYMNAAGLDPSQHPTGKLGIQAAAGAAESVVGATTPGMILNSAKGLLADLPMAHAADFSNNQQAKQEGYRATMATLLKGLDTPGQESAQKANEMANYFLKQHGEGLDKQIDPSTWDRLRMNQFNFEPSTMVPVYGQARWIQKFLPQLMHSDEPGSASSGAVDLGTMKSQMIDKVLRNMNQSRLANHSS